MRRNLSFVAVLALALIATPAVLADAAPAAPVIAPAPDAPAAAVGGPALCPTTDPLGNPAAEPTYVSAGPCFVQRQCDDGSTISCNGASSCSSGPGTGGGYVTCDGATTWCPTPPPPPTCPQEGQPCSAHKNCGTCLGAACFCSSNRCICLA